MTSSAPSLTSSTFGPFMRGALLLMLAMLLFDIMGAIIKYLGTVSSSADGSTYSALQLSVFRNAFGLIPSVAVLVLSSDWHEAGRPLIIRQWRLGFGRGIMVAFAQLCFYASLTRLEFATATTLAFVGPLFITALSVPILGLQVGRWRWFAVALGFAGVVLVMQPGSDVFTLAALLPAGAAFGYALSSVSIKLMDSDVPIATINIYSTVGALLGSTLFVSVAGEWQQVTSLHDWLWLFGMGIAGGFAVLCLIAAYRSSDPGNLAPFEYFGILFSYVIGYFWFAEAPFDRLFPGALLIVAAGLLIVWRQKLNEKASSDS